MEEEVWDELGSLGQTLFDNIKNVSSVGGAEEARIDDDDGGDDFFENDDFFKADAIHDEDACKWILHYRIAYLRIRAWDLLLFVPSVFLLSYLLFNLQSARLLLFKLYQLYFHETKLPYFSEFLS
jgi:hypothetical protein